VGATLVAFVVVVRVHVRSGAQARYGRSSHRPNAPIS